MVVVFEDDYLICMHCTYIQIQLSKSLEYEDFNFL